MKGIPLLWLELHCMCSHFCGGSHFRWQLWLFALTALVVAAACGSPANKSPIVPGRSGFIKYQPGGAAPCHERLLLAKAHSTHWAIATPDLDVHVEDIMDPVNLDENFCFGCGGRHHATIVGWAQHVQFW